MRGLFRDKKTRSNAEAMRAQGKSYREIREKFNIPKSTLSYWFNKKYDHIFNHEKRLAHLEKIRPLALEAVQKRIRTQNTEIAQKVSNEIKFFPLRDKGLQKCILASLYWAEGKKSEKMAGLKFANTDPKMISVFVNLLRNCYEIDESRLKIALYVHRYHKIGDCKKFWSNTAGVPLSQFYKTYLKKRSSKKRFKKNFMGVCFVYYFDSKIRKELLELCNQLTTAYAK